MLAHKVLDICVHAFIRIQGEHVQHRLKHQTGQCYTMLSSRTVVKYNSSHRTFAHSENLVRQYLFSCGHTRRREGKDRGAANQRGKPQPIPLLSQQLHYFPLLDETPLDQPNHPTKHQRPYAA